MLSNCMHNYMIGFFSHSTSNSAGMAVAVHRCTGAKVSVAGQIPGWLIALDIECYCISHLVNIYMYQIKVLCIKNSLMTYLHM